MYVVIYSGGWAHETIAWGTAPTLDLSPLTKHGSNGKGSGRSSILVENGTLFLYHDNQVCYGPSPDALSANTTAIAAQGNMVGAVNSSVVNDGGVYRMICESRDTADLGTGPWKMWYLEANNPLGPFTLITGPLTSLQLSGGMYGGPCLRKHVDGSWSLWYHASVGGGLPTDIYRARTTNITADAWTDITLMFARDGTPESHVDQAADPFLVADRDGIVHLFFSAVDNGLVTGIPRGWVMRSNPAVVTVTP